MTDSQKRVARYLQEALATERALITVLRSQIAMTPRGPYRDALETHLPETERHAKRVKRRLDELDRGWNPLRAGVGAFETITGQLIAIGKAPLDLLRGDGGEEKVLKNAKDAAASEAMEIATYAALEAAARSADDDVTARLAGSIRREEDRMLERVLGQIPSLAHAAVEADQRGESSYELSETGAADAVRSAGRRARHAAEEGRRQATRAARQSRKVPGVARAEGEARGTVASVSDLPVGGYDRLTAQEILERLPGLSQVDLATVDAFERRHQDRATIRNRIASLRDREPWPGYDALTAAEVREALSDGDEERARGVRSYERVHKNRAGVLEAAERARSHA